MRAERLLDKKCRNAVLFEKESDSDRYAARGINEINQVSLRFMSGQKKHQMVQPHDKKGAYHAGEHEPLSKDRAQQGRFQTDFERVPNAAVDSFVVGSLHDNFSPTVFEGQS
jgi:hypothetical protein